MSTPRGYLKKTYTLAQVHEILEEKKLQNKARKQKTKSRRGQMFIVRSYKLSGVHFLFY